MHQSVVFKQLQKRQSKQQTAQHDVAVRDDRAALHAGLVDARCALGPTNTRTRAFLLAAALHTIMLPIAVVSVHSLALSLSSSASCAVPLIAELKVGYHDEGGSWPFVAASLSQRLPLRCIEWKNLVGATKFIDKLPLTFVAQSELDATTALPLVCVYLVNCEDMDHYRASVKQQLAAWVERMNAARVEWMVLYVPLGTRAKSSSRSGANNSNSVYKKIFDKIRADFAHKRPSTSGAILGAGTSISGNSINNSSSLSSSGSGSSAFSASERICKIEILEGNSIVGGAPGQHQQHESQWSELLLRLRHCIMDAFQIKCYQYEEEVRVLDAKRNMNAAGWDFGAFFLAKERLALMYQQTYLLDDAIRHLDELDAIFMNLSDNEKRSFQDEVKISFRANDAIFTTAPLAVDLPTTQQQIAKNRASTRVIQLHCFCRQIRTLYLMGNFPQLIQRAISFISSFFESLKQLSTSESRFIEHHQPYQWAVGACLEIAYACELSWNGHDYQISSASVPSQVAQATSPEVMSRHLGDILYLARRTLTLFSRSKSGAASRLSLPLSSGTLDDSNTHDDSLDADTLISENPRAWYEWLQRMFSSSSLGERFERCVWEMSHLASLHFLHAGRHRFAVFLGGECARYHFRHREFESASRLFRSHSRQCEEDKWWNLVGDCVRNICSSELELGRAAEAVAVCFSMLAITQEAKAEIGRDYLEKMMHTLVQSLDQKDSAAKLRMGELVKPSVGLETMQTPGSDLDYGEVRVTLSVANCFPAGIHIEKLQVRFSKRAVKSSSEEGGGQVDGIQAASPKKQSSSISSTLAELPRLHSLILEDESPRTAGESPPQEVSGTGQTMVAAANTASTKAEMSGNPNAASQRGLATTAPNEMEFLDIDITLCDQDEQNDKSEAAGSPLYRTDEEDDEDDGVLILEESNVYLYEKANVNLVFLHSSLDVGSYVCSGVECVLAGNTFSLLSGSELEHVSFEIPRRESTLRIDIVGPPLLTPQSIEQISIKIHAQSDTVADGVIEMTSAGASRGDAEEEGPSILQFLRAEIQTPTSSSMASKQQLQAGTESLSGKDKLLLSIPALSPGDSLVYNVWLRVGDADSAVESLLMSTVFASLRYQHVTLADTSIALRRAEAAFQILRPLEEHVRLKRVGSRVIAAISLTCNGECGLMLRDYRLDCSNTADSGSGGVDNLTIVQDPNARLRNSKLRPGETVHLAFTLTWADDSMSGVDFPDEARFYLDLQYDSAVCGIEGRASDVDLQQESEVPVCWQSTFLMRIPFDKVRGAHYRIDVEPKVKSRSRELLKGPFEFAAGEEITFQVVVREFGADSHKKRGGTATQGQQQPEAEEKQGEEALVLLCLDESSERDWIVLGKQHERFQLREEDESSCSSVRTFSTHKRLISTRVGRLRFPNFYLRDPHQRISSERVLYSQSTMQVIVT